MNSMEDACSQLMRPPRELASWNFPLSNILEEYFNLLPEPCKISFGEAAFIIQNSVNAYVRRVEELYDETKCFSEKIVVEEQEAEKNSQKEKKLKKNLIDLSQFECISFKKEIGKNINLKRNEQKPIKFLHQCFSQLENSHSRLNVKVFDIQGEVIGKKYDFRCNQNMNRNGTLVEEFTLKDFESSDEPSRQVNIEERESFQSPLDSNFLSTDEADSMIEDPSPILAEKSPESFQADNAGDNIDRYDQSSDDEVFTECSTLGDSGITDSSVIDPQENNNEKLNDGKNDTADSLADLDPPVETTDNVNSPVEGTVNIQDNVQDNPAEVSSENSAETIEKKSEDNSRNRDENNKKSEPKRSKRLKRKFEEANSSNETDPNLMQPIPFENGIPEKLEKSRKEFKLPCHIALLKRVPRRPTRCKKNVEKKIKLSKKQKDKTPERIVEEMTLENMNLKCQMYSPSGPFLSTKEESPSGFRRNLDQSFGIRPDFTVQYQPITTLTMDLLGFAPSETKSDPQSEEEPDSPSDFRSLSSPVCTSPSPSSPRNPYPPNLSVHPETLEPCTSLQNELVTPQRDIKAGEKNNRRSSQKYHSLVKCKIEEIYKELDLQTDEDQKVAKWHEEIKPRLKEAELKPPFCIHDYESKIKNKLKTSHKKLSFDDIVREEPACEIARYFSATLQLASTNNLNINSSKNPQKSIELILLD